MAEDLMVIHSLELAYGMQMLWLPAGDMIPTTTTTETMKMREKILLLVLTTTSRL